MTIKSPHKKKRKDIQDLEIKNNNKAEKSKGRKKKKKSEDQ